MSTLQLPTAVAKIRDTEPAIIAFQHMVETVFLPEEIYLTFAPEARERPCSG